MNKKLLLTLAVITAFSVSGAVYAAPSDAAAAEAAGIKNSADIQTAAEKTAAPEYGKFKKHDGREFLGEPPEFRGHHGHGSCKKFHPSKEEMEKKKAEFEKRLKLTDSQKKQIEENRKLGHEQVKPIFEQKKAKMQEMRKIQSDNSLTPEQKQKKIDAVKADMKKLNTQADALREENMKSFESLLTDKQKKEFSKIKEEQKKDMEKRRADFEKKMKNTGKGCHKPCDCPHPEPRINDK